MIRLSYPIEQEQELLLEAGFYEWENCPWMIVNIIKGGERIIEAYFNDKPEADQSWEMVKAICPTLPQAPNENTVEDADWKNEYKKYLKPWSSGELHWVPVWERQNYNLPQGHKVVWLDAGMAFGTGAHETTRLCAERLLEYKNALPENFKHASVIDAGCGSGILGISAKLLGFGDVYGFDIEEDAIRVSKENADFNGINSGITFNVCGLAEGLAGKQAEVVVANIIPEVLNPNCEILVNAVKPKGWLVLSGVLSKERGNVQECFQKAAKSAWGDYKVESRAMGEWVDLCFFRQ